MGKIKGSFANTYDRFVKRQSLLPPGLLELLKELGGDSILEFACGTGTVASGLALDGYKIVGVDYSEDMIKAAKIKARKHNAGVRFIAADITTFKMGRKFDIILCLGNVIPQFKTTSAISKLMANCRLHLKDGGHLVFQMLNYDRILKNKPSTFAIDIDRDAVRFKQYRYRQREIDFIVTVVDGATIPPKISKSKIVLKPWKSRELESMVRKAGFGTFQMYGNYSKAEFNLEANDLILIIM